MKNRKLYKPAFMIMASGLLIGAVAQLVERFTQAPDSIKGVLFGVAIGVEIIALIKMKKVRAN